MLAIGCLAGITEFYFSTVFNSGRYFHPEFFTLAAQVFFQPFCCLFFADGDFVVVPEVTFGEAGVIVGLVLVACLSLLRIVLEVVQWLTR